jgi:hypothetical protein
MATENIFNISEISKDERAALAAELWAEGCHFEAIALYFGFGDDFSRTPNAVNPDKTHGGSED